MGTVCTGLRGHRLKRHLLGTPEDTVTHFLLYLVAATMRKSRRRAWVASGPESSFCSSWLTREQNFASSSAWISLHREDPSAAWHRGTESGPPECCPALPGRLEDAGEAPLSREGPGGLGKKAVPPSARLS